MRAWLGVVSADHVARAVSEGVAQVCHGRRAPLARMRDGDILVYYSPKTSRTDGTTLKAFTAVGEIRGEEIWQVDMGAGFTPFRRTVDWDTSVKPVALSAVQHDLELTSRTNWGYELRRGLLPLSFADLEVIKSRARGESSFPRTGASS